MGGGNSDGEYAATGISLHGYDCMVWSDAPLVARGSKCLYRAKIPGGHPVGQGAKDVPGTYDPPVDALLGGVVVKGHAGASQCRQYARHHVLQVCGRRLAVQVVSVQVKIMVDPCF